MTTETITQTLTDMIARLERTPFSGHTGSGLPTRRAKKVIAGHLVQVWLIGWEGRIVVELDKSTEPLSISEAAERMVA